MAKPSPNHAGDPILLAIGRAIRDRRLERGLSQEGLAHEVEIDRSYMGGIERGEHNVTIINLSRICTCLDLRLSELLSDAGQ